VWPRATRPRSATELARPSADGYNVHHQPGESDLACPFFMPIQKLDGGWLHPSRLPLGGGWHGTCSAPGHEGTQPSEHELHEFCNLGYAAKCSRMPVEREFDAIRFSVARDQGSRLLLWFVCETGHRPARHGTLQYDIGGNQWVSSHSDPRIQKMAECYVQAYLQRRIRATPAELSAGEDS
jgi:hypothetical protein